MLHTRAMPTATICAHACAAVSAAAVVAEVAWCKLAILFR
jgi:hypothetical protein